MGDNFPMVEEDTNECMLIGVHIGRIGVHGEGRKFSCYIPVISQKLTRV
jgi:hypothetical protein